MKKLFYLLWALPCLGFSNPLFAFTETPPVYFSDTTRQTLSLCEGDSLLVGNSVYTEPGVYQDVLLSSQGEDSVVITYAVYFPATSLLPPRINACKEAELALEIPAFSAPYTFTETVDVNIPDGTGAFVEFSFIVENLPPGQTIQGVEDIGAICLNMEHSWLHDLEINLTCPSGQNIVLQNQAFISQEVFLGEPYELDDFPAPDIPVPGTGWDYCWTPGALQTMTQFIAGAPHGTTLPEGDYRPFEGFEGLIGCPMNGPWTIQVIDQWGSDNGWIFDGSIAFELGAEPPLTTYFWSTGDTIPSIAVNAPGIYSISVTLSSGCVIADTTEVALHPVQIVPFQHEPQFIALPGGASPYRWYRDGQLIAGTNAPTFHHNDVPGIYTVRVDFDGLQCESQPFQMFDFHEVSSSPDCAEAPLICGNMTGHNFTFEGNGAADFETDDNQPGCLGDGESGPHWYRFVFSDDMPPGSVFEFEVSSEQDSVNFDFAIYGAGLTCDSLGAPLRCSYASFGGDGFTGLHSDAPDTSEDLSGDGFVAPLVVEPGQSYHLLLNTSLSGNLDFQLTVGGEAAAYLACADDFCPLWINVGEDFSVCHPDSFQLDDVVLNAPENTTYEWIGSDDAANAYLGDETALDPVITVPTEFASGRLAYTLVVSDGHCAVADQLIVAVGPPDLQIVGDSVLCAESTVIIHVSGDITNNTAYQWSTGSGSPGLIVSHPGLYGVTVSDGLSGCIVTDTVEVVELDPAIESDQQEGTLTVISPFPGATFQWYFNDQPIVGATQATLVPLTDGPYDLVMTYLGISCRSNAIILVAANETETAATSLKAMPNPTGGKITLQSTAPIEMVWLLNAYGQRVMQMNGAGVTTLPLDLSLLPSGVYWVMARMEGEVSTLKIAVTR